MSAHLDEIRPNSAHVLRPRFEQDFPRHFGEEHEKLDRLAAGTANSALLRHVRNEHTQQRTELRRRYQTLRDLFYQNHFSPQELDQVDADGRKQNPK